jgi:hypothetical protein
MSDQECRLKAARYGGYKGARSGVDEGFMIVGVKN